MEITIKNLSELHQAAGLMLKEHSDVSVFAFYGKMGAGKTTFIKTICQELGVIDEVTSPTFAIVNEYMTKMDDSVYHFDFYRIENQQEAFDIGFDEYLYSDNYCFIEWSEKVTELLPENYVKVNIEIISDTERKITTEEIH